MIDYKDRETVMVLLHGEVCGKSEAAKLLDCGTGHINTMLEDGRLDYACGGRKVCVRSIARYIAEPRKADEEARKRRIQMKYNCEFAV